ncbi:hypothetical protein CWI36_0053p0030 [Hamiltosporidium magnivora]|uniref:Uncharacterized protein n=1 Tax=Hamiltosporidium magnivora TaxID=148818 RepID=A0A4Q9LLI5_9MICR|nr:hypothetical protein CWI36_0053p0030 [Hamiltosporidium magnivora]
MYTAADKNEVKWSDYDEIRTEMFNNPFVYYVSMICLNTFRKQNVFCKIIVEKLELPYPLIYDQQFNDSLFAQLNLHYLFQYERDIFKLFSFLQPQDSSKWILMLSFRILYTFFCFFKENLVGYSDMFNEHPCFKNMLERILGKHLILNYIEYDRSFAENNEIEIKLLEFDLNAYFEKESIIFNLENSQTPTEAALSHMMQPEIEETVTFGSKKLTITAAQSLNASDFPEKDVNMIEVNEENATLNSYSKTYQTFAERNKVTNQTDNVILSSEVMRMNTEEINHSRNNIIYKSDSKDILKLDLELFFEKIFQANLEIQAKKYPIF